MRSSRIRPQRRTRRFEGTSKTIQDKTRRFGERLSRIENGEMPDERYNKKYYLFMRIDNNLRKFVREPFFETIDTIEENKVLAKAVKKYHFANCAELTRLSLNPIHCTN